MLPGRPRPSPSPRNLPVSVFASVAAAFVEREARRGGESNSDLVPLRRARSLRGDGVGCSSSKQKAKQFNPARGLGIIVRGRERRPFPRPIPKGVISCSAHR